MRTNIEVRLECLRQAVALANSKNIGANEILVRARSFLAFVNDDEERADPAPLAEKYRR